MSQAPNNEDHNLRSRHSVIGWIIVLLSSLLLLGNVAYFYPRWTNDLELVDVRIGRMTMHLEIADTDRAVEKGLSGLASLANDAGMLFIFPKSDIYPFWMKGMQIPLDIIWLEHGVVVDMTTLSAPVDGQTPARHVPRAMADRVMELRAGRAAELGLRLGSYVEFPFRSYPPLKSKRG